MNLNNGDKKNILGKGDSQDNSYFNLFILNHFDWWRPEWTATCLIIVTIVENHTLIIDVCVSKTKS